jgi:hypothetical protein
MENSFLQENTAGATDVNTTATGYDQIVAPLIGSFGCTGRNNTIATRSSVTSTPSATPAGNTDLGCFIIHNFVELAISILAS